MNDSAEALLKEHETQEGYEAFFNKLKQNPQVAQTLMEILSDQVTFIAKSTSKF